MDCKKCGKRTTNRVFCSRKCAHSRKFKKCQQTDCEKSADLRDQGSGRFCFDHKAKYDDLDLLKKDGTRRLFLIREVGHFCWECKNTTWNGKPIPLQLDHIDGDHTNNSRLNLRVICPNCHAQTPTYCGRNIGKHPARQRTRLRM